MAANRIIIAETMATTEKTNLMSPPMSLKGFIVVPFEIGDGEQAMQTHSPSGCHLAFLWSCGIAGEMASMNFAA